MGPADIDMLCSAEGFWYLASPYSKYPGGIETAFHDVCEVAAYLISQGVHLYCPIAHTHPIALYGGIDPCDHDIWLPVDQPFMDAACGLIVATMDTWHESYGIQEEIVRFTAMGKPIYYLEWPAK